MIDQRVSYSIGRVDGVADYIIERGSASQCRDKSDNLSRADRAIASRCANEANVS
jgi:hypothetical protein